MLQVANCLSLSAAKNDHESCLRQFEHLCRVLSSSSEERLFLDPAGEGEDILNEDSTAINSSLQQTTPYNKQLLTRMQGEGKETTQSMAAGSVVVHVR
jgi:hypothetical protein